jgi:tetratricopeptide (TPR) repeat protein
MQARRLRSSQLTNTKLMKVVLIFLLSILVFGCNNAAPVANSTQPINVAQQSNDARTVLAHSGESSTPKPMNTNTSGPGKPSSGGDPIDTEKFDAAIATAEKDLKSKPSDAGAKKALADAFFARGFALTQARQYASALGDYRRALKLDPNHEESKKWVDQIVSIYSMLKKSAPKEGEEPPPLPFKKEA